MEKLRDLLHSLVHGPSVRLRKYELAALQAWRSTLPSDGGERFDRQKEVLRSVHRYSAGRLLVFFPRQDRLPANLAFPDSSEELLVAIVTVVPRGQREPELEGRIVLHKGWLSSLEFRSQPSKLGFDKGTEVDVKHVKVARDPMRESRQGIGRLSYPHNWGGCFESLNRISVVRPKGQPVDEANRQIILAGWGASFPEDYLEIVSQADGLDIGHVHVLGLTELRSIVLPDHDLIVLAEIESKGVICLERKEEKSQVVFLQDDAESPEPLTERFCEVIKREILKR